MSLILEGASSPDFTTGKKRVFPRLASITVQHLALSTRLRVFNIAAGAAQIGAVACPPPLLSCELPQSCIGGGSPLTDALYVQVDELLHCTMLDGVLPPHLLGCRLPHSTAPWTPLTRWAALSMLPCIALSSGQGQEAKARKRRGDLQAPALAAARRSPVDTD